MTGDESRRDGTIGAETKAMAQTHSRHRYVVEAVMFLTYALFGVSWMALAPLGPDLMTFFHVSKTEFSFLNTVVTIAKVIAPIVTGAAAVRFGLKRTILLGSLLICAVLAGPLAPSFQVFVVSRFLFGLGGAVVVTSMAPMAMQWFPRSELPAVNAWNGVAANSGIAVAMYVTTPLAGTALGWRGTLVVFGALNAVMLVAWALLGRENKDSAALGGGTGSSPEGARVSYLDVWRMKETWLATLAFTGAVALYLSFSYWLPTFYQEQFHFDRAGAARYSGIVNLAGIPSAIICGYLTQRLGVRRPFLIVGGLIAGTVAFGMFLFASPAIIMASAILLGVALFIPTAAITTLLMELPGVTPRHVSLIMGTMFSFCYVVSAFAPNLVAVLRERTGSFVPGFITLTVLSWVIFVAGFLLPETGPRARAAAGAA
ncbi:putative integral membrane protein [Minicystis rosea]|nr:putative integral membrane protein [Minicystis rosea]